MSGRSMLRGFFTGTRLKVLFLGVGTLLALSFALIWSSQSSSAATQGPVAAWSFDENTGETVKDLDGETDGTVEHAKWKKGRYGSALEFDGEESCITVPNSATLQLQEEFTLEAWVRPESTKEFAPVFFKEDAELDYGYALMAGGVEGGHPSGYVVDGVWPAPEIEATAELPVHVWSHLALTFDGAHIRLYVNGELVASDAAGELVESHGALRIGCGDNYGYWDWFEGRIDEPRIYERALSPGELAADMETPLMTPKQEPVAKYSFDSVTEAGTVKDLAGTNDGTVEAAKLTEPAQGRYGQALEFDGEESCVTIPDGPQFEMGEEFTVEAWVRPDASHEFSPIFYKQDGEGGYGYALWAETVGEEPEGEVNDGTYPVPRVEGSAGLPAHTWSHLAFTYDGGQMRLYVDGELVDSGPADAPIESEGPLKIGCAADFGYDHYFEGRIDEPRIYERALSPGEVAADMETPVETPKSGPVAAYSFDEGEPGDETVEDITGNLHTATIEGEAEWTRGRYGGALGFLKEGDCASVADSPDLRLSEEFTLEAWVRPVGGIYEDPVVVRESGGEDLFGIGIGSSEEGYAEAFIGEGPGSKTAVGGKEIRQHEWVHLAATWDGAKIRLFVDGELAATKTATTPPGTGEGDLRIGCDTPSGPFGGRIDEVRVYRRTLNAGEVAADMETPMQTPKATPVAKYSFDEKNEETATDLSGDGHTATVDGATWTEHGRYGGAYEFDAEEGDILRIPASSELSFDEEFTLEAWVRPSGEDNKGAPLIAKQEGSGLGYSLYEGGTVSDRPVGAVAEEQEHVHADDPLPAHAWSHVALTFTGNRTYLYVNGELVDNGAAEPVVTSEGELEIGGSTDTSDYFDGRIDEVRIYNRELDAAEIDADMETPIEAPKQGPVAAWSFDEGTGTTAEDITGDGNTATIEGAEWKPGKYGSGLKFNGTSSCVSIADAPDLRLAEEFTLESWVRPEGELKDDPVIFKEGSGHLNYALELGRVSTGKAEGVIGTTASPNHDEATSVASLEANVWSHVAVTFDGAKLRLYMNGELVDTEAVSGADSAREGALKVGCDSQYGEHFKGRLDEVRIYERALTPAEAEDTVPPRFDPYFSATAIPGAEETTYVEVSPAVNGGKVGMQDPEYAFRYSVNSGPMSAWRLSSLNYIAVATPEESDEIHLEVYASNASGYQTATERTTVTAEQDEIDELTEQEELESQEEFEEEAGSGEIVEMSGEGVERSGPSADARSPEPVPPGRCTAFANQPHYSHHADEEGKSQIRANGYLQCGSNGGSGTFKLVLMKKGVLGRFVEVTTGGRPKSTIFWGGLLAVAGKKYNNSIRVEPCVPGFYKVKAVTVFDHPLEGYEAWNKPYAVKYSGSQDIDCKRQTRNP